MIQRPLLDDRTRAQRPSRAGGLFVTTRERGSGVGGRLRLAAVGFAMRPDGGGTQLTHTITITPKTLMAKLMSPMIKHSLPKQTISSMNNIKAILDAAS